jgi:ATP-dependent RNA helicase DDX24/MAK5
MIQQGSFPELSRILDVVHLANPMDEEDEDDEDELLEYAQDDGEASDRLLGLPGLPGEAKVEMLNSDILDRIEKQRIDGTIPDPLSESESDGADAGESDVLSEDEGLSDDTDGAETGDELIVVRRTYVYSATLTLPATSKSSRTHRKHDVDGAIAEILEKSRARGRTKIVDLTTRAGKKIGSTTGHGATGSEPRSDSNQAVVGTADAVRLPPGLSLHHIKCTQKHKDSHLYAYLMTTEEGAKGPCLVFCNSIAAVRRVGATLMALGMEVRILHAQMQQVCHFAGTRVRRFRSDGVSVIPELVKHKN